MSNFEQPREKEQSDEILRSVAVTPCQEAADALERLKAGDVELPEPEVFDYPNPMKPEYRAMHFTDEQLKDYGDRRAAAAVIAERERCAMVCDTTQWSSGIVWWKTATKSEISIRSAKECASAIRKGTP